MKITNIHNIIFSNHRIYTMNFDTEIKFLKAGDHVIASKVFNSSLVEMEIVKITLHYVIMKDIMGNVMKIKKDRIHSIFSVFAVVSD